MQLQSCLERKISFTTLHLLCNKSLMCEIRLSRNNSFAASLFIRRATLCSVKLPSSCTIESICPEEFLDACEQESVIVIFSVGNYNIYFVDDSANRVREKSERDRETSAISCGRKILHFK